LRARERAKEETEGKLGKAREAKSGKGANTYLLRAQSLGGGALVVAHKLTTPMAQLGGQQLIYSVQKDWSAEGVRLVRGRESESPKTQGPHEQHSQSLAT
jgi:hypothetical protein